MRRDLTTGSTNRQDTKTSTAARAARPFWGPGALSLAAIGRLLGAMALGALLVALAYQIPVQHAVDLGGFDAGYVQGFYDSQRIEQPGQAAALAGSDGSARWTRAVSYLLFPQAGLPAELFLRLRGWKTLDGQTPEVMVLLQGATELGRFRASGDWEERHFTINGGLLKPNDVVIEIHADTAPRTPEDPRPVGVLLDRAIFRVGHVPIIPYPAQLVYGALAAGMLYLLGRPTRTSKWHEALSHLGRAPYPPVWVASLLALMLGFLALYRAQPLYPYPWRGLLPTVDGLLAALLALRYGPTLARRTPAVLDALALGGVLLWTGALLRTAGAHVTLSTPGVEKDFRVFATRSDHLGALVGPDGLDTVLRADGFYNLGYPLLLWLIRPLTGNNPFLAAQLIAAVSAALLLGATWWLARRLLGRGPALVALMILALSPLTVQYGLYLGTDMPFAALFVLALALLLANSQRPALVALAGLVAGTAFLIRHPGILLLPLGWLALWITPALPDHQGDSIHRFRQILVFSLAFLLATLPQLIVNSADTGQPLYSQQAKNIWLAVYGDGDWGRWGEVSDDISLGQVLLQDPGRFLANWWANIRGYLGTGSEDSSEFGRAYQLRLLGFPANWLSIAGLLGWLVLLPRPAQAVTSKPIARSAHAGLPLRLAWLLMLICVGLYLASVSVGLSLPRFFLPLAPIYAIAAAWLLQGAARQLLRQRYHAPDQQTYARLLCLAGLVLLVFLTDGFMIGSRYVLDHQPADEVAAVHLIQATLQPGEQVIVQVPPEVSPGKYSAIAHLVAPDQQPMGGEPRYMLQPASAAPPDGMAFVGQAGSYILYRIGP